MGIKENINSVLDTLGERSISRGRAVIYGAGALAVGGTLLGLGFSDGNIATEIVGDAFIGLGLSFEVAVSHNIWEERNEIHSNCNSEI